MKTTIILFFSLTTVMAQQPPITNAQLQTQSAAGGLQRTVQALLERGGTFWISYSVPSTARTHNDCCGTCSLEDHRHKTATVSLSASDQLLMFLKAQSGAVEKVRFFSRSCTVDADGATVHWIEGVQPADSVAYLTTLVEQPSRGAVVAIALHADSSADRALIELARRHSSSKVRGDGLFWLAQRAGDKAAGVISEAIEQDPETDVKKKAVFALSQLGSEGVPRLIEVARSNRNAAVRKQAMFWLGQSRDPRALDFFEQILLAK